MSADIFGPEYAECSTCELEPRCHGKGQRPVPGLPAQKNPNGLMIIGDGPGMREVAAGMPFVGRHGDILDDLLNAAGLKRHETHLTTATLAFPPKKSGDDRKKKLHARFPNAVYSCMPRLEAEIEHYKPRVVLAMGEAALTAATGFTIQKNRHVPNDCANCDPKTRKIGPAIACAVGTCDWVWLDGIGLTDVAAAEAWLEAKEELEGKCPKCEANVKRLKLRQVRCPKCKGKKKRVETRDIFKSTYGLLGKNGIAGALWAAKDLDARWDELGVEYVICTLSPSYCLHSAGTEQGFGGQFAAAAVLDHMQKAARLLERPSQYDLTVRITDQADEVRDYIESTLAAHGPAIYEIDIETNAKSPWDVSDLRCIGIGRPDVAETLVVDTRRMVQITTIDDNEGADELAPRVPLRYEIEILDEALFAVLEEFLTDPSIPKSAQNGAYDYLTIRRLYGIEVKPIGADTKVGHHSLKPDEPHTLAHIAAGLTETPHWKEPKTINGSPQWKSFTDLAVYNARDVRNTALSRERMVGRYVAERWQAPTDVWLPRYTEGGLIDHPDVATRAAYDVDIAAMPIAIDMEFNGVPVNVETLQEIEREKRPEWKRLLAEMQDIAGQVPAHVVEGVEEFNPQSPKQLAWVLYGVDGPCQLTCPKKTDSGAASTDKETLAKLADDRFVQLLLKWRAINHVFSNYVYGKKLVLRDDGRVHPSWNTTGARTGRWSSSPNFQNWPIWLRRCIEAPEGWVIVGADYSQLELRIMAALCGDPELIRRCRDADEGRKLEPEWDPHSFVASEFFGEAFTELSLTDPDETKRRKALREVIKSCIYGMNYGAGAAKVLEAIYKKNYEGMPLNIQMVRQAIEKIFGLFPGVPIWRDGILARSIELGEVRSQLLGRWRTFPWGQVDATIAWNYPIQATGADIINLRQIVLADRLKDVCPQAQSMAQVHDALYYLCPEDDAEKVAHCVTDSMSVSLSLVDGAPEMPFNASAKIGRTWDQVS